MDKEKILNDLKNAVSSGLITEKDVNLIATRPTESQEVKTLVKKK